MAQETIVDNKNEVYHIDLSFNFLKNLHSVLTEYLAHQPSRWKPYPAHTQAAQTLIEIIEGYDKKHGSFYHSVDQLCAKPNPDQKYLKNRLYQLEQYTHFVTEIQNIILNCRNLIKPKGRTWFSKQSSLYLLLNHREFNFTEELTLINEIRKDIQHQIFTLHANAKKKTQEEIDTLNSRIKKLNEKSNGESEQVTESRNRSSSGSSPETQYFPIESDTRITYETPKIEKLKRKIRELKQELKKLNDEKITLKKQSNDEVSYLKNDNEKFNQENILLKKHNESLQCAITDLKEDIEATKLKNKSLQEHIAEEDEKNIKIETLTTQLEEAREQTIQSTESIESKNAEILSQQLKINNIQTSFEKIKDILSKLINGLANLLKKYFTAASEPAPSNNSFFGRFKKTKKTDSIEVELDLNKLQAEIKDQLEATLKDLHESISQLEPEINHLLDDTPPANETTTGTYQTTEMLLARTNSPTNSALTETSSEPSEIHSDEAEDRHLPPPAETITLTQAELKEHNKKIIQEYKANKQKHKKTRVASIAPTLIDSPNSLFSQKKNELEKKIKDAQEAAIGTEENPQAENLLTQPAA